MEEREQNREENGYQETQSEQAEASQETQENLDQIHDIAQEQEHDAPKKRSNDENIRFLREQAERAKQLEEERDRYAQAYMNLQQQYSQPTKKEEPEEEEGLNVRPDDLIEGRHLAYIQKKYDKKYKELEKKYEKQQQKATAIAVEAQLKAQYPDFDSVVSEANIKRLREQEPELASTIRSSKDLYSQAIAAYKLIKNMGISQTKKSQPTKMKAEENMAKPRSSQSIPAQNDSPISKAGAFAHGLDEETKKQIWKEMCQARKNY